MVEGPAITETITRVAGPGIRQDVMCPDNLVNDALIKSVQDLSEVP